MQEQVTLLWSLGPAEIAMLLVLAIFIFGPKRLPELGQALGDTLRSFRSASKEPKGLPPSEAE
ncbi:twin-arginine translocase TatA/TatE family subunit [bacterium]|nr:twin-arginine translocase TatA/TatE family subunit [bacterium]